MLPTVMPPYRVAGWGPQPWKPGSWARYLLPSIGRTLKSRVFCSSSKQTCTEQFKSTLPVLGLLSSQCRLEAISSDTGMSRAQLHCDP